MFTYNIAKIADLKEFEKICKRIEESLSNLKKEKLLTDVDGTKIQIYRSSGRKIKVLIDYEVDAVYIDSEMDLKEIISL